MILHRLSIHVPRQVPSAALVVPGMCGQWVDHQSVTRFWENTTCDACSMFACQSHECEEVPATVGGYCAKHEPLRTET